jgi:hypothetical protein
VASLGNIPADEVIALETLRLGLRSDTLDLLPRVDSPASAGERTLYGDAVRLCVEDQDLAGLDISPPVA